MKIILLILGFIYLVINALFILKYASRLPSLNPTVYMAIYALVLSLIAFLFFKTKAADRFNKVAFFTLALLFFIATVYLNITVDGESLQVDRWSAMHSAIEGLFQGRYPYAEIDHMGGRTSNLPGLIGIGIPFYLLGNIGYLQSFCFIIFAHLIYIGFKTYRIRLIGLLLLILSPSYLWEIYAKSDLMSNFILLLAFTLWAHRKYVKPNRKFGIGVPIWASVLLLTRLTAVIPLSILLAKHVFRSTGRLKLRFFGVSVIVIAILTWMVFYQVLTLENFKAFNPFSLQNRQLPILIPIILGLTAIITSFYVKRVDEVILTSAIGLLLPVLIAFTWRIFDLGFSTSLFDSGFDISYFNMAMPFLIYGVLMITIENKANQKNEMLKTF